MPPNKSRLVPVIALSSHVFRRRLSLPLWRIFAASVVLIQALSAWRSELWCFFPVRPLPQRRANLPALKAAADPDQPIAEEVPEPWCVEKWSRKIKDLKVGDGPLSGLVTVVTDSGLSVDIGGDEEGFVHISKVTGRYIVALQDLIEEGDMIKVWVDEFLEEEKTQLRLSMIQDEETGSEQYAKLLQPFEDTKGQWFNGTVVGFTDYGCLVEVCAEEGADPVRGLMHVSSMSEDFVDHASSVVSKGQTVPVRVERVVPAEGTLRLSILPESQKEYKPIGNASHFVGVKPEEWFTGNVTRIEQFGVFFDVETPDGGPPVDGFVHISEMSEERIVHPSRVVSLGQDLRFRILEINERYGRLRGSMIQPRPETEEARSRPRRRPRRPRRR